MKCICTDPVVVYRHADGRIVVDKQRKTEIRLENIPVECESLAFGVSNWSEEIIHMMVYNMPVREVISLFESGGRFAVNDFYRHSLVVPKYFAGEDELLVTVFALDKMLNVGGGKHAREITAVMQQHVVGQVADTLRIINHVHDKEDQVAKGIIPLGIHD